MMCLGTLDLHKMSVCRYTYTVDVLKLVNNFFNYIEKRNFFLIIVAINKNPYQTATSPVSKSMYFFILRLVSNKRCEITWQKAPFCISLKLTGVVGFPCKRRRGLWSLICYPIFTLREK